MRLLEDHLENRLKVPGRGVDHLQHLRGRGLLLQRLALFGQKSRILDGDDRLVGEGSDKFDLPVGKGLHRLTPEDDNPGDGPLTQQRNAKHGSGSPELDRLDQSEFRIGRDIGDMDDPPLENGASGNRPAVCRHQPAPEKRIIFRRGGIIARRHPVDIALADGDCAQVSVAEPCRSFEERLQYRRQIERRLADHLQHVSGRSLVFERLLQVAGALLQLAKRRCTPWRSPPARRSFPGVRSALPSSRDLLVH